MASSSSNDHPLELIPPVPDSSRSSLSTATSTSTCLDSNPASLDLIVPASGPSTSSQTSRNPSPSPSPSILRSSSSLTLPSRTGSPKITFAPLPPTEPRKRNTSLQLGVAARSRLLRHRRMLRERGLSSLDIQYFYSANGTPLFEEIPVEVREAEPGEPVHEETRLERTPPRSRPRRLERERERERERSNQDPAEDAFASLGKLVKGVGRTIWRRKSKKDMCETDPERPDGDGEKHTGVAAVVEAKQGVHLFEDDGNREDSGEGDGSVWVEEISGETLRRLLSNSAPGTTDADISSSTDVVDLSTNTVYKRTSTVEVLTGRSPAMAKVR
ncbi:hypothetical protein A0H81_10917 [Grifola frondosa]|uniref:Uncharacterized protein n=1 Tax=Grifola frondosa TaxID=5627 RepID=A0A1C7LWV8_GRIFR|nr:hypothetical protein A0H81_10917 [Grifola frondosa]